MLSVTNMPNMLSVVLVNVVMLSVVAPNTLAYFSESAVTNERSLMTLAPSVPAPGWGSS